MTVDEERQYREIHEQVLGSFLMRSATVAGEAVKRGVKYRVACEAIYAASYQALFSAALKDLQNAGDIDIGVTVTEAWEDRELHEQVSHEIVGEVIRCLSSTDHRHSWSVNILKKKKKS